MPQNILIYKNLVSAAGIYFRRRLLVVLVLGIISGLPLALTASTLFARLTESGVSLAAIGVFSLVTLPYSLKFLWSPLVDGLKLPFLGKILGHRRGWLILAQLLLMGSTIALGLSNPQADPWWVAFFALLVAFFSATQDIVIDAYRVEILNSDEQATGAGAAVLGYRLGVTISGAGALYLATYFGWVATYLIMAAIVPMAWLALWLGGEPAAQPQPATNHHHQPIKAWLSLGSVEKFI